MTDEEITEIETRTAAATRGPWRADIQRRDCVVWGPVKNQFIANIDGREGAAVAFDLEVENCVFVAAAREDVPRLVIEVKQLREVNKILNARIAVLEHKAPTK